MCINIKDETRVNDSEWEEWVNIDYDCISGIDNVKWTKAAVHCLIPTPKDFLAELQNFFLDGLMHRELWRIFLPRFSDSLLREKKHPTQTTHFKIT